MHYNLDKESNQTWTQRVDALVTSSIQDLQTAELVTSDENNPTTLVSTPFGDIMSKVCPCSGTLQAYLTAAVSTTSGCPQFVSFALAVNSVAYIEQMRILLALPESANLKDIVSSSL